MQNAWSCRLENPSWGYDRIVGALANLGHIRPDGGLLRRHGISPAPKRKQSVSWMDFIRAHRDVLVGMDFFMTEVLTLKRLTTYYVLFFIHLETRQVKQAGFTRYPDQEWMEQQARNMTMEEWGYLRGAAICCMIEIRSSANHFENCSRRET